MAEVALLVLFCVMAVYVTLAATVFVGTPPTLSRSITVVAHGVMNLRTYLKRSGRVDEKLAVFDNPLMEVLKAWQSK
jgi:hypothetical protein